MPRLRRIRVYPIKSLDGVDVDEIVVLPSGALKYDRQLAIFDAAGTVVNAKRTALIQQLRTTFALDRQEVTLHSGPGSSAITFDWRAERQRAERWLSEFLRFPVTLRENCDLGFPDDVDAPGPTMVSVASLEAVRRWFPGMTLDEVRRRFRANLEVDADMPFWEDRLFQDEGVVVPFRIGQVDFAGTNPCQRCVVPTRCPETGEVWPAFSRTFAVQRERELPTWAVRTRFNHFYRFALNTRLNGQAGVIRVGDELRLTGENGGIQPLGKGGNGGNGETEW